MSKKSYLDQTLAHMQLQKKLVSSELQVKKKQTVDKYKFCIQIKDYCLTFWTKEKK